MRSGRTTKKVLGPSERRFTAQYKKALKRNTARASDAYHVVDQVIQLAHRLWREDQLEYEDIQMRSHHWAACLVLATDTVLRKDIPDRGPRLDLMTKVLLEPNAKTIRFFTRMMLMFSSDPFRSLSRYAEKNVPTQYGVSFKMETLEKGETTFVQGVKQCFYNSYFRNADRSYLTALFCGFDKVWIDVIEPGRDRVEFRRPMTLQRGDDLCRFEFHRTE